jgi:hypothetical protein
MGKDVIVLRMVIGSIVVIVVIGSIAYNKITGSNVKPVTQCCMYI